MKEGGGFEFAFVCFYLCRDRSEFFKTPMSGGKPTVLIWFTNGSRTFVILLACGCNSEEKYARSSSLKFCKNRSLKT